MKVLSWLQNKLSGCHGCNKSNSIATNYHLRKLQESRKEEFSNWPDELLAIGTFGNNDLKQHPEIITNPPRHDRINNIITSTNDVVPDDDDALALQLEAAEAQVITSQEYLGKVEQLLNEEPTEILTSDQDNETTDNKSLVLSRRKGANKDVDCANKKRAIVKRTVSFLLEKMFVCKSGFSTPRPLPSLRDPPAGDPRMEKILRAILNKKIHPQGSSQGTPLYSRRYIENGRHRSESVDDQDKLNEKANNMVDKWVRTDSEYIVLEI